MPPVMNSTPVTTKSPPMTFSTVPRWARKRRMKPRNGPENRPATMKGMPRPSE